MAEAFCPLHHIEKAVTFKSTSQNPSLAGIPPQACKPSEKMPRFPIPKMKAAPIALSAGLALLVANPPQSAQALTVNMLEVGNDVVMSGSGSLNLAALSGPIADFSPGPFIYPTAGSFLIGGASGIDVYFGDITFPSDFGTGAGVIGDGTGAPFGPVQLIFGFGQEIWVPSGYQSGAPLNASAIFQGETLASLGVTPGIYSWTWGSGADADDLTLHVEQSIPPVPGPLPLLGAGAAFGWSRRLRKRCLQSRR